MNQMKRNQKGFSLIELLIVVAIILIIAAIAIPNLIRSRIAANEASAVGSMRTINTSEITYATTFPSVGFAPSLTALGSGGTSACGSAAPSSTAACLIDEVLANATTTTTPKSGYYFTYVLVAGSPSTSYTLNADPASAQSGTRHFFTDQSGVIRYNQAAAATGTDNPIQ